MLYIPSKSTSMNIKTIKDCDSLRDFTSSTSKDPQRSLHSKIDEEDNSPGQSPPQSARGGPNSILGMIWPPYSVTPVRQAIHKILSPRPSYAARVTPAKREVKGCNSRSCLVYLIRHGEASHNVLEKAAKRRAKKQAESQGLSPEQVEERMEQARVAVLTDETLRDASLSQQGREDANEARRRLDDIVHLHALTPPGKVLVSPLTRTLETANLIFPKHDTIHVREELQERQTGKPCDCRQSSSFLSTRPSFQRFQMDSLRQTSSVQEENMTTSFSSTEDDGDEDSSDEEEARLHFQARLWMSDCRCNRPRRLAPHRALSDPEEEDRASLRQRTRKLLGLLDEPSIAVITHKGYLRELERGTLELPEAKEFVNGEIRVYRIHLDANGGLEKADRVI